MATSSILEPMIISGAGGEVLLGMLNEEPKNPPHLLREKTPEMTREEIEIMLAQAVDS